ncbi:MAG: S24 family peptidase [bacterium]|nr:S24 family peptidase [bacterium]
MTYKACFPTGEEDEVDIVSLESYLISDPHSSFLYKVKDSSLRGIGIFKNDLVIVDKKKSPSTGDIILVRIEDEGTLKIFKKQRSVIILGSSHPDYPNLYLQQEEFHILGIVTTIIRKV